MNEHPLAAALNASPLGLQIDSCLQQLRSLTISHAVLLVADDGTLLAQHGNVAYTDELRTSVERALRGRANQLHALGASPQEAEKVRVDSQVADCILVPPHWMLVSLSQQERPLPWVTAATQPLLNELRSLLLSLPQ